MRYFVFYLKCLKLFKYLELVHFVSDVLQYVLITPTFNGKIYDFLAMASEYRRGMCFGMHGSIQRSWRQNWTNSLAICKNYILISNIQKVLSSIDWSIDWFID